MIHVHPFLLLKIRIISRTVQEVMTIREGDASALLH